MENNSLLKNFTRYVGLNIIGLMSSTVCIFIDYLFIAMAMGADGLAALSFATPAFTIMYAFGLLLGVGGGAKYAEQVAKGKQKHANGFLTVAVKMCCIIAVPLIVIGVFFSSQISMLLGADGHIIQMTADYIRVIFIGSPFLLLFLLLTGFERNDGSPKIAMIAAVIHNGANILFDYIFIIVFDWGMFGASLATMTAAFCAFSYLCIHWLMGKANFRIVKTRLVLRKAIIICGIGGSSFLSYSLYSFLTITFNITLNNLGGNIAVAAFGIITSLAFLVQNVFVGIGQGIQPIASFYYGKNDSKNLEKLTSYAIRTNVVLALVVISVIFLFTDAIVSIFNSEHDVALAVLAMEGVRIYFIAFLFYGTTFTCYSFLSVTSNPRFALVASFLQGGGLTIPIVIILSGLLGVTGVWISYPVSELILVIINIFFLHRAHTLHRKNLIY